MAATLKEKRTFLTMGINVLFLIYVGFRPCTVRILYIYQFWKKKNLWITSVVYLLTYYMRLAIFCKQISDYSSQKLLYYTEYFCSVCTLYIIGMLFSQSNRHTFHIFGPIFMQRNRKYHSVLNSWVKGQSPFSPVVRWGERRLTTGLRIETI